MELKNYMQDGADAQSRAVLAMVQALYGDGIEDTWDDSNGMYRDHTRVARWHNGREKGYVISTNSFDRVGYHDDKAQLNIAFFEHRNNDDIHAILWESEWTINPPTIDDADLEEIYTTKYDTTFAVPHGGVVNMAQWIMEHIKAWHA